MPYRWTDTSTEKTLRLWPHQSLTERGFAWFIGATAAMLALPLLALLGSPVVWILLAFFAAAIAGVWRAIMVNRRDLSLHEELTLKPDHVRLAHIPPTGPVLEWEANPHWVRVRLHHDGPVENYLTLSGNGREVQIGAFLSPEEREGLYDDLTRRLKTA